MILQVGSLFVVGLDLCDSVTVLNCENDPIGSTLITSMASLGNVKSAQRKGKQTAGRQKENIILTTEIEMRIGSMLAASDYRAAEVWRNMAEEIGAPIQETEITAHRERAKIAQDVIEEGGIW